MERQRQEGQSLAAGKILEAVYRVGAYPEEGTEAEKEVSHLEGRVAHRAHQEATCLAAAIRRMVVAFAGIQVVAACWKMISFRAQWECGSMDLTWWERHAG